MTAIPGLEVIPADNAGPMTGTGNWTYLMSGRSPALIDAGVGNASHIQGIAAALARERAGLDRVIVTHAHQDHAAGAAALLEQWATAAFMKYPWPDADQRYAVSWAPVVDGQRIDAGDVVIEVVHTPGHAPDHICLWHASSRTLFGGDLLVAAGTVVIPGSRGGSLSSYLSSLTRVEALAPAVVLPAHGPVIDDPIGLIRQYRAHRAERERQILNAIGGGAVTVAAIRSRVYPDLAEVLHGAAEDTVRAHLDKLRDDGRIEERDERLVVVR